jgi:dTMP kinase
VIAPGGIFAGDVEVILCGAAKEKEKAEITSRNAANSGWRKRVANIVSPGWKAEVAPHLIGESANRQIPGPPSVACTGVIISGVTSQRGKFITFEGLDGCGKSTQTERLAEVLRRERIEVVVTREPGGTPIGERIRAILLDSGTSGLAPMAELALMFSARVQHLHQVILPALEAGKWVVCDRFTDSSEAYQGGGRKLGSDAVLALHRVLCGNIQPDLTVLMDSEVSASVSRARRRNLAKVAIAADGEADENRFEQENRNFFTRVHEAYLAIAKRERQRVFMVDARRPGDIVHREIVETVRHRFLGAAKTA